MKPSLPANIARVGPRSALRIARHGLDDDLLDSGPWYDTKDVCKDDAIFIGGSGRSGTTLLREVLSRHSRVAIGPESHILSGLVSLKRLAGAWNLRLDELQAMAAASPSVIRFAETFFRDYARKIDKPRWADKSPGNVRFIQRILSRFPNGRFVHMLRDGRDVACSLRHHPAQKVVDGKVIQRQVNNPISRCARRWARDVSAGLAWRGHPRYIEVRFEDLTGDPESTIRRLCDFLGEEFEPSMLRSGTDKRRESEPGRWLNNENAAGTIVAKSQARWVAELSRDERDDFVRIAGELLIVAGYVTDHSWLGQAGLDQARIDKS
jgi:hypothetical protein